MTRIYQPDRWVIVRFVHSGDVTCKVFAGFAGGYTIGESWQLSSGITKIIENEDYTDFVNISGSVYRCYGKPTQLSVYMCGVYEDIEQKIAKTGATMEIIDPSDISVL